MQCYFAENYIYVIQLNASVNTASCFHLQSGQSRESQIAKHKITTRRGYLHNKDIFTNYIILSLICHATSRNPLKLSAHTSFLNLALSLFLRVFKVTPVTKFHQVTRLADFALESTKCTLNGLTITNVNLDFDSK